MCVIPPIHAFVTKRLDSDGSRRKSTSYSINEYNPVTRVSKPLHYLTDEQMVLYKMAVL